MEDSTNTTTLPTSPETPVAPVTSEPEPQPTTPQPPVVPSAASETIVPKPAPADQSTTPPLPPNTPTPPLAKDEKHAMSLRTIVLILVLALLAGVLLFVALRPLKKPVVKTTTMAPTVTPSPAHSILALALGADSATPSSTGIINKTVDVTLDTQTNKDEGVQFEIAYDPTVLTNVTVAPGTLFQNPLVLLNQVDTKNGKINYALGIQPTGTGISGSGTVAVISYILLPTATATETTLKFLPKTQVVQQGTLGSVLEKSIDLVIPVTGLTPAPSGTSSAQ
jgi:hypothetical protein